VSDVLLSFRGREIRAAEVGFLRNLIAENPALSRRALSARACEAWNWVQSNGQLRDMVCRSLMLKLHRAGHIELPPPGNSRSTTPWVTGACASAPPKTPHPSPERLARWDSWKSASCVVPRARRSLTTFSRSITTWVTAGRWANTLKYLLLAGGRPVACLGWSSAPLKLDLRDRFVGAPQEAYRHNLHLIAYNTRFLIVPWVRVPHLASQVLGVVARRISADWQGLYHHPIHLLESFVDTEHFGGTCYRAANWICVGRSEGRGTKSVRGAKPASIKDLLVYPLGKNFRQKLLASHE